MLPQEDRDGVGQEAFVPPAYAPAPLDLPHELAASGWSDGVLPLIGNDGMDTVIGPLCDLFCQAYPGLSFTLSMRGSATAMPALVAGASWFAPMSRDPWTEDTQAYRRARGHDPWALRLGYTGHGPRTSGRTPPAMYVHASNPLAGATLAQLARVFTRGAADGELSTWGQLGLEGAWRARRIHVYGMRDTKYARGLRHRHFAGLPYAARYEALPSREDVIRAVAQDPYGIGAVGWVQAASISDQVRVLALAGEPGRPFETPDLTTIASGGYPLKAWVSLFLDLAPGQAVPALLREFGRLALSREGQRIIAARTHEDEGYVPLCERDWRAQLRRLG
ncbi:Phosphate ABC transporter, periplasmic phosphate-binding protein PstS (TC 3.A.1.7.1) [plant metagenome]|uniref:Phosphate ABC transporter, periplasmic phosphate-binding protein PstS (TC 3.A.1.7.1) n=1 Tax=plant metagenome TaxID=1297885 RepID=A0A484S569_9ZZZZ